MNAPTRLSRFLGNLQAPITQSKEHGAWPLVRALADPVVEGGEFWGPSRIVSGGPRRATASKITRDPVIAARLWNYCEHATTPWPYLKASKARRR